MARTAIAPEAALIGGAIRPTEAPGAAVCYVRSTSIRAVRWAQSPALRRRLGELVNST
jgi:hypothetical protein